MSRSVAQIAAEYVRAHNEHDAPAVASLYAADGEHLEVASGRGSVGPEAIQAGLIHFLTCFPDAHWETEEAIAAADAFVLPYVLTGTLQAQLGPFPGAGQILRLDGVQVVQIQDSLIARSRDFWDARTFGEQMRAQERSSPPANAVQ